MIQISTFKIFGFLWIAVTTNDLDEEIGAPGLTEEGARRRLTRWLSADVPYDDDDPYWEKRP